VALETHSQIEDPLSTCHANANRKRHSWRDRPPRLGLALAAVAVLAAACGGTGSKLAQPSETTLGGRATLPQATPPPMPFSQLEGVYRQGPRSYDVTYQGWWLDITSQAIRQLQPSGAGDFTYGPAWMLPSPSQGALHFHISNAGNADRVTGIAPGGIRVDATRLATFSRDVTFPSSEVTIAGTITVPPGGGRHPGLVILQGSGRLDRHFESISDGIYASMGFAVLSFDKRGAGQSTGTFPGELATPDGIGTQAADAAAGARFLMGQPEVDPHQVGFDGNSQGGWVAPLATEQVPGLRFEILISAPAVTSDQQMVYAGFSGGSAYVPKESDATIDAQVRSTASCKASPECYDPAPALKALHAPTLWIYGQLDRQVPVRVSVDNLASYNNPNWTVDVLPGGNHGTVETSNGLDSEVIRATRFAGNYFAVVRAWLAKLVTLPAPG
jgi:dienelactone hydrolase